MNPIRSFSTLLNARPATASWIFRRCISCANTVITKGVYAGGGGTLPLRRVLGALRTTRQSARTARGRTAPFARFVATTRRLRTRTSTSCRKLSLAGLTQLRVRLDVALWAWQIAEYRLRTSCTCMLSKDGNLHCADVCGAPTPPHAVSLASLLWPHGRSSVRCQHTIALGNVVLPRVLGCVYARIQRARVASAEDATFQVLARGSCGSVVFRAFLI